MIIDNTLVLSDHQAVTADAGSTNVIDFGAQGTPYGWVSAYGRDMGDGFMEIPLLVEVTEAFNNLTSLQVSAQTDDNAAFSSATTVVLGPAVLLASLVAGYRFNALARVPKGTGEQYFRLYYDVTGTAPTTGKIFAAVTAGDQTNTH
jgi:hypothetical protein